jgi:hypothetical protein
VSSYINGYIFSELNPTSLTFNIGQYPSKVRQGEEYVIGQALRYKQTGGKVATARFVFRVHITNVDYGAELTSIDYDAPTGIGDALHLTEKERTAGDHVYDLRGHRQEKPFHQGIFIVNGEKRKRR